MIVLTPIIRYYLFTIVWGKGEVMQLKLSLTTIVVGLWYALSG